MFLNDSRQMFVILELGETLEVTIYLHKMEHYITYTEIIGTVVFHSAIYWNRINRFGQ